MDINPTFQQEQTTISRSDSYAEVVIPLALPKSYTWKIPLHLHSVVQVGMRVEVNFGKSKKYAGIVTAFVPKPADFQPKEILNVLDDEPLVHGTQLAFWKWIAAYYVCTEGEVMQAAVPSNFKLTSESILNWSEEHDGDFTNLNDNEYIVAEALLIRKQLKMTEIQQLLSNLSSVYPVIKSVVEKGVCYLAENLKEKYVPKTETYIELSPLYASEEPLQHLLNSWAKAPKQLELLLAYLHLSKTEKEVTQTGLLKMSGASTAQLKGLIQKGILNVSKRNKDRLPPLPPTIHIDFELSARQQEALEAVRASFQERKTCLLHGVTASGKTQIYIKLIEEELLKGKQVLYMLPEIALTAQIIRRLQQHFGGNIGVYHSKFNHNERVEIWRKVKSGSLKIVLGARSSLFLPFADLGLIILDEEHETSFKQQEPAPRYHARDAAIYYASLFNAKVLLGSATPSLESYHNASTGKFGLVKLTERFGATPLPEINIVDVKKFLSKQKLIITPSLEDAINDSLKQQRQIILFQNRRGYSPYLTCNVCGWIPQCIQCAVTLTYHKHKNKLACHYCGTNYPTVTTCSACGSQQFISKQYGTEKIEEHLLDMFPGARIARMDYDTVKGKHAHDNLIKLLEQHKVDILVGTQMVVKGLHFENVDLVGIIDADNILHFADFRVNERAFQLMEQVSGRAGRSNLQGKVMIQVNRTTHPVLAHLLKHDYEAFYQEEIEQRQRFFYPPFSRIIKLVCKHALNEVAEEAANVIATGMRKEFSTYVVGPAQPSINRVRNQYIWEILIRLPKQAAILQYCKQYIRQQILIVQSNKRYRSVVAYADVDAL